jgi:hypothetical protein
MVSGDFLSLGLHLDLIIAGSSGGICGAYADRKARPLDIIGSIVVGALTANYLSATISNFLGTVILVPAFAIGLAGMPICQKIIKSVELWTPFKGP